MVDVGVPPKHVRKFFPHQRRHVASKGTEAESKCVRGPPEYALKPHGLIAFLIGKCDAVVHPLCKWIPFKIFRKFFKHPSEGDLEKKVLGRDVVFNFVTREENTLGVLSHKNVPKKLVFEGAL